MVAVVYLASFYSTNFLGWGSWLSVDRPVLLVALDVAQGWGRMHAPRDECNGWRKTAHPGEF